MYGNETVSIFLRNKTFDTAVGTENLPFFYTIYRCIIGEKDDLSLYPRFAEKYWHISIFLALTYVMLVYGIRKIMKTREPFSLRGPLFLWSAGLSLFSVSGFFVALEEIGKTWNQHGVYYTFCEAWPMENYRLMLWCSFVGLSKLLEFGDTIFMVLRKRTVLFLHVYHHASVLILCAYIGSQQVVISAFFGMVNGFVHAIMYFYFALKTLRIDIPKSVSMGITSLQIFQMIACILAVSFAFIEHLRGSCKAINTQSFLFIVGIYLSYVVLFSDFFKKNYLTSKKLSVKEKAL